MQVASAASSLDSCVIIGAYAAYPGNVGSGCIVIGNSAQPSSTSVQNEITLGNSNITHFRVPGIGVSFTSTASTLPAANFEAGVLQETYFNDTGGGIQSNHTHDILTYGMVWNGVTTVSYTHLTLPTKA